MSKSCSRVGGSTIFMVLRLQVLRVFGTFSRLPFLMVFLRFLSAGTRLSWSLLAIFMFVLGCHGAPLGRSFASVLSLLCLLAPVRTSWLALARQSFPNGHKTAPRWTLSMSLKLPVVHGRGVRRSISAPCHDYTWLLPLTRRSDR